MHFPMVESIFFVILHFHLQIFQHPLTKMTSFARPDLIVYANYPNHAQKYGMAPHTFNYYLIIIKLKMHFHGFRLTNALLICQTKVYSEILFSIVHPALFQAYLLEVYRLVMEKIHW